jgi:diguanylate cyclase (GGDEF)-like protein
MASARVLIVEDDRFYLEFYRDILEKEGYKVEAVSSSSAALKKINKEPFDLVIADIVMRGGSGLELLTRIKKERAGLDVIMVTSIQSLRKAVEALQMGASDYLTKPVDENELLFSIRKILERQVSSREHSKLISENIHFYELLRIQKKNLALLSILDSDRLQEKILDICIEELHSPGGILYLKDQESGKYSSSAIRGIFQTEGETLDPVFRTGAMRESLESGRAILESVEGDQWVPKENDEGLRLVLPILFRRECLGAVKLAARLDQKSYSQFDIDLGRNILDAAGMALNNALAVNKMEKRHLLGPYPGTYSPGYFRTFADSQLTISNRYSRETSLLLVRLTNYQSISRRYKERQVERIIGYLSKNVLEIIRDTDVLSRLEKDLLGIIVPETDFYGALMLKKRLKMRLSRTSYPLDLKSDLVPLTSMGCSASPRDGNHYHGLLTAARERLMEEERSIIKNLHLDEADLWKLVGHLLHPDTFSTLEKETPDQATSLRPIQLSHSDFDALVINILKDLESFSTSRGLLYMGIGTVDPNSPLFFHSHPDESLKVSIFALGRKGPNLWNIAHITPVFIDDTLLTKHLFILGLSEDLSYGLFCRVDGQATMTGFHTSDQHLVLELVSRLQEQYLLQRRIG